MSKKYVIDETDKKIIDLLKEDGRMQWREIGEIVHITGQAVGDRVRRLIKHNVITGFHASVDEDQLGKGHIDYVTVIMTSGEHERFIDFTRQYEEISEVYRISGNGCYMMRVDSRSKDAFNEILERLLKYGNYSVNSVVKKVK